MTIIDWIMRLLGVLLKWDAMPSLDNSALDVPIVAPTVPVAPPAVPTAPMDKVRLFALEHQVFEGWYPGSNAFKHNNPGNLRSIQGPFITFPTYEAGFLALENYIRNVATGKHKAYPKGGKTTIMEYTHIYTSDAEPSPTNYATALAKSVGTTPSQTMGWLLT